MIELIVKELETTLKQIQAEKALVVKSAETAVKVECYRLMKKLKADLKSGKAGGQYFSPLSEIAKRLGRGGPNREPLSRLASAVRYGTMRQGDAFIGEVGFVDGSLSRPLSKQWKYIAEVQQEGAQIPLTEERRQAIISIGASMMKKNQTSTAKYFFLRKSTTSVTVPSRPILDPFIAMHRQQAETNIVNNFERKMRGERI